MIPQNDTSPPPKKRHPIAELLRKIPPISLMIKIIKYTRSVLGRPGMKDMIRNELSRPFRLLACLVLSFASLVCEKTKMLAFKLQKSIKVATVRLRMFFSRKNKGDKQ